MMFTGVLLALATVGAFYLFGEQKGPASARIVHIDPTVLESSSPDTSEAMQAVPIPSTRPAGEQG